MFISPTLEFAAARAISNAHDFVALQMLEPRPMWKRAPLLSFRIPAQVPPGTYAVFATLLSGSPGGSALDDTIAADIRMVVVR